MKSAILAATALLSSTILSTPAFADTIPTPSAVGADATTLAAMQTQCDALAAAHDTANGDIWSGEVVPGAATLIAGPTEVEGTRVIDEESIVGTGTYVPSALFINGDPYRVGGSVNMFGDQRSSAGYYPDSTYNYTADFTSTFSYAFSCNINDAVYHPLVPGEHHDAVPVQGFYTNTQDNGNGDCHGISPANPHWGTDLGACIWTETAPAQGAYDDPDTPAYNSDPAFVVNEAGVAVNQDQTDSLNAFEDHGGQVQVTGEFDIGQVVVCISPTKNPGTWRLMNGYTGTKCNTTYFKSIAPTVGSTTSQGTFISVPDYNY